jgi:aryl-alcohol dehydrogenase-like predicted oxidoreductase
MKHISIGGLDVSRIGLGAMSMAGYYNIGSGSDAESIRTIHRALDLGVTHVDTAEIYGPYINEELVGRAIKDRRAKIVLATKFGIVSHSGGGPGVLDSTGGTRCRGQGPPHRTIRGRSCDDPARSRRASSHCTPDRVLPVDP